MVNLKNVRISDEVCNSLSAYLGSEPNSRINAKTFKSNIESQLIAHGMEDAQLIDVMGKVYNCINNKNDTVVKVL